MRKFYFLYLLCFGLSFSVLSQTTTVTWNFGTTVANASPSSGTPVSNVTISDVSQGNNNGTTTLLTTTSASGSYTGSSGQYNAGAAARTGALATGSNGSAYFEFTVTPTAGYDAYISSLNFGTRSTSTAPQAFSIRTSLDGYSTDVATGSISNNSTWSLKTNAVSILTNSSAPVTIRIYGHSGTGSAGANTANWRIDDLSISVLSASAFVSQTSFTSTTEGGSNGNFLLTFSPTTAATTSIDYAFTGTATFGTDYTIAFSAGTASTATASGTLTVPAGTSTVAVSIIPTDDASLESTETVVFTLSNPTNSYTLVATSNTINVIDNDFSTVSVAAGTNGAEPSTNGTFTLTLSSPAPVGGVAVNYTLAGTATAGTDYSDGNSGSITIPEGASTATLTLTTINDAVLEATETINITLTGATSPYTLATSTASINLSDDSDMPAFTPISYTGVTYSQNFNTLATSSTSNTLPTGWTFSESGSSANNTYAAGDGSGNGGNTYSFGTGTNTDRAFGGLQSGSVTPTIGGAFTNNSGSTIYSLIISYTGEQWRLGATGRADRLDFQYSTNATSLTTGTWTDIDGLDFIAPVTSGSTGALTGNDLANSRSFTYTLTGLSIPAGANFYFRWADVNASGSDDGLAIDDFSLSPGCTPPASQPTGLSFTPALQSISGSFTGTTPASDYLVLVSPSASLTQQPATGTVYALDDAIGNARVVSIGSSTSFTANSLTPGTTYYFFVYTYGAAQSCYNLTSPLTASTSTTTPPPCTAPATSVTNLTASTITATSIDLAYTRGSGDNVLILARAGAAVNEAPINSISYTAGTQIGSGNFVIYTGAASSYSYTGLTSNTTYHFAVYEYNSADNCYQASPLTGSYTTACTTPVDASALAASTGNGQTSITWTNPSSSCFDEVLVVVSTTSITGAGSDYPAAAATAYGGGTQVVYRGTGSQVTVTGLANSTTYYVKVFTKLGSTYSSGVQTTVTPFDPATGYRYLFGNLHAHSSYSDGNKDNLTNTPDEDYAFARDAQCMDFLGISEHNHTGAGMQYGDYKLGYAEANAMNLVAGPGGNTLVTLFGMEWGVISGGGHVLVYGFDDQLIGWEAGQYDVFVAKNDYPSLWTAVNNRPGAFATLAHPNSTDFSNLASGYTAAADNAIVGAAVESGPAFSTSTTYNDYPSSLSGLSYYKTLLARGYRVAPQMDQDNHNLTFGTANANRMVVLATAKTRAGVMDAIRNGRFYASQDCNVRVDYRLGSIAMGGSQTDAGVPSLSLSVNDADGESVSSVELWGGEAGNNTVSPTPIKTYTSVPLSFSISDAENAQPNNTTYYYYAIITQADGNKIVTAPIWYNRNDAAPLPVTFTRFTAKYDAIGKKVTLDWATALEQNSRQFVIERSADGKHWTAIGTKAAAGNSHINQAYQFVDAAPLAGVNIYRLRQEDVDGKVMYSKTVSVTIGSANRVFYTLYPNPAKGQAYVYSTSDKIQQVTVLVVDHSGRQLKRQVATSSSAAPVRLDLNGLTAGAYFIKVIAPDQTTTEKLIVE